jgi:hypothetical protein
MRPRRGNLSVILDIEEINNYRTSDIINRLSDALEELEQKISRARKITEDFYPENFRKEEKG